MRLQPCPNGCVQNVIHVRLRPLYKTGIYILMRNRSELLKRMTRGDQVYILCIAPPFIRGGFAD